MNTRTSTLIGVSLLAWMGLAGCGPSSDTKGTDGKSMSNMDTKVAAPAPKADAKPAAPMAQGDMKGMDHSQMKTDGKTAATHKASATVKSADANAQVVRLDHAPVASLNWPAMTMSFKVKDKAMLDKLTVGKKVEVEFVQQGGDYVITDVR